MDKKRLVLIDGHALLFRAFYAIPYLTAPDGRMVNAVYGFTSTLLSVIEELEPTHMAVCFDSEGPTKRKEVFDDYKANRKKPPEELVEQFGLAFEVVEALNMPLFAVQGYEGDDLIGTLAEQVSKLQATGNKEQALETIIVTGDLDTLQLVDDKRRVRVYVPGRRGKPTRIYQEADVVDKLGIGKDQVVDLKGLAGDASDNIPGIRGVGPKTAVTLLKKFGSIEGIYRALEKGELDGVVGKAMIKKIKEGEKLARESRELARIVTEVPIKLDLEACRVHGYDKEKTLALFEELGFASLVNRLPKDEFEMEVQKALF